MSPPSFGTREFFHVVSGRLQWRPSRKKEFHFESRAHLDSLSFPGNAMKIIIVIFVLYHNVGRKIFSDGISSRANEQKRR